MNYNKDKYTRKTKEDHLNDYFDQLAESILKLYDKREQIDWEKPWKCADSIGGLLQPFNGLRNTPYKGKNNFKIIVTALANGYQDPRWITACQAKDEGGHVKKGEKATKIAFYKFYDDVPDLDENGNERFDENGEKILKRVKLNYPVFQTYNLFNVEQCEGFRENSILTKPYKPINLPEEQSIINEKAEHYIRALKEEKGLKIFHGGDQAAYLSNSNSITVPLRNYFSSSEDYYHTVFHEISHWTKENVERKYAFNRGSEEFVADIGGFLICRECNLVDQKAMNNLISYLDSWSKDIYTESQNSDNRKLFKENIIGALKDAYDAEKFISTTVREYELKHENEPQYLQENERIYLSGVNTDEQKQYVVDNLAILDEESQKYFITNTHDITVFHGYIADYDNVLKKFKLTNHIQNHNELANSEALFFETNKSKDEIKNSMEKESNAPSDGCSYDLCNSSNFIKYSSFVSIKKFEQLLENEFIKKNMKFHKFPTETIKEFTESFFQLQNEYINSKFAEKYDPEFWLRNPNVAAKAITDIGWNKTYDNYCNKYYPKPDNITESIFSKPSPPWLDRDIIGAAFEKYNSIYQTSKVDNTDLSFDGNKINKVITANDIVDFERVYNVKVTIGNFAVIQKNSFEGNNKIIANKFAEIKNIFNQNASEEIFTLNEENRKICNKHELDKLQQRKTHYRR